MKFRPCIDLHNGQVKQIVGSSLVGGHSGDVLTENFVSEKNSIYYARLFKEHALSGGHVICLDRKESTKQEAMEALKEYPGGLQVGGGITPETADAFLSAGASHVIVTSYIFHDGLIDYKRLEKLFDTVGKEHLVLDLSAKRIEKDYYIATDRWEIVSREKVTYDLLFTLQDYCDEFLIHAADVEGKRGGIETDLIAYLSDWEGVPITYAGGIATLQDIHLLNQIGKGRVDFTVGSALDLYGGDLSLSDILSLHS